MKQEVSWKLPVLFVLLGILPLVMYFFPAQCAAAIVGLLKLIAAIAAIVLTVLGVPVQFTL